MSDTNESPSEATSPTTDTPAPAPKDNRHVKTIVFVVILVGVVGVFQALNVYADPPPDMPGDLPHTLMLNNQNALIGVGDPAAWPTHDAEGKEYPLDKKSIERRVNLSCTACAMRTSAPRRPARSSTSACRPTRRTPRSRPVSSATGCPRRRRAPSEAAGQSAARRDTSSTIEPTHHPSGLTYSTLCLPEKAR